VGVTAEAARALVLGGPTGTWALKAILWSLGLLALFIPLGVTRYRRT
jgi:ABC-2 type transport system permease protein/oleandomycin transport system permease protein